MLSRHPFVLLGVAAVLGLGAALAASRWLQNRASAAEESLRAGQPVVVAATDISFGDRLTAENLKTISWPKDSAPEGTYSDAAQVIGRYASQRLVEGEMILESRAVTRAAGSSLSELIEPNKRAVTVRVNDVIGVGGFLLPGNRVDVLATRMLQEQRRAVSRTILQNLKVLAVDQTAQTDKDKPVVVRAVTLEMDPGQAELLAQAEEEGTLQLSLRNPDDASVTNEELVVATSVPAPVPAKPAKPAKKTVAAPKHAVEPVPPPKTTHSVTVIRQSEVGNAEVNP